MRKDPARCYELLTEMITVLVETGAVSPGTTRKDPARCYEPHTEKIAVETGAISPGMQSYPLKTSTIVIIDSLREKEQLTSAGVMS